MVVDGRTNRWGWWLVVAMVQPRGRDVPAGVRVEPVPPDDPLPVVLDALLVYPLRFDRIGFAEEAARGGGPRHAGGGWGVRADSATRLEAAANATATAYTAYAATDSAVRAGTVVVEGGGHAGG